MTKVYYVHLVTITTKSIILYNIHCKKEQRKYERKKIESR